MDKQIQFVFGSRYHFRIFTLCFMAHWHTLILGLLPELVLSYQVFNLFYFTLWAKPYNLLWHYPNLQSYRLKGCQVVITLYHIRQGKIYGSYTFSLFFHALARTGNQKCCRWARASFPSFTSWVWEPLSVWGEHWRVLHLNGGFSLWSFIRWVGNL